MHQRGHAHSNRNQRTNQRGQRGDNASGNNSGRGDQKTKIMKPILTLKNNRLYQAISGNSRRTSTNRTVSNGNKKEQKTDNKESNIMTLIRGAAEEVIETERNTHNKNRLAARQDSKINSQVSARSNNAQRGAGLQQSQPSKLSQTSQQPSQQQQKQQQQQQQLLLQTPEEAKATSTNTFSILNASRPTILVLRNLVPGTSAADVKVSILFSSLIELS